MDIANVNAVFTRELMQMRVNNMQMCLTAEQNGRIRKEIKSPMECCCLESRY